MSSTHTKLHVLDLFSGIGGFSLGLERTGGFETAAFCEIEPFCQKVLKKHWPGVPVYSDVRMLRGYMFPAIDVITGGYPCQPFSYAGKRGGEKDNRHLWPQMFRLIQECRPRWVFAENVAGHITMGLDEVLSDLEAEGYTSQTFVIPACASDAPHRRDRVWIVANSDRSDDVRSAREDEGKVREERIQERNLNRISSQSSGSQTVVADTKHQGVQKRWRTQDVVAGDGGPHRIQRHEQSSCKQQEGEVLAHTPELFSDGCGEHTEQGERQIPESGIRGRSINVANTNSHMPQGSKNPRSSEENGPRVEQYALGCNEDSNQWREWLPEPNVVRVAYGVSRRVDRLRGLGNAVVPQIPEIIGNAILQAEVDWKIPVSGTCLSQHSV